jgi:hypothetical protein
MTTTKTDADDTVLDFNAPGPYSGGPPVLAPRTAKKPKANPRRAIACIERLATIVAEVTPNAAYYSLKPVPCAETEQQVRAIQLWFLKFLKRRR